MSAAASSRPSRSAWPLALVAVVLILAATGGFIFYRLETLPARTARQALAGAKDLARTIRDAVVSVAQLQPRVTVNDRVYYEQTTPIAELALVSRRVEVEHEMLHTWAGSTKRIRLHGTYAVKAGFDLREPFNVQVQPARIGISLPAAKILGVEQVNVEVLALENGYWNAISAADLESELRALATRARDQASAADLAREAEKTLETQLRERLHIAQPIEFRIAPSPVKR